MLANLHTFKLSVFCLNSLFKKKEYFMKDTISQCQTAWMQIRPDILQGLIWVQTVSKHGYCLH